ncbi:hypothetical protein Xaut_0534 [Xanthobacter versatilis]|uniref:Uncharacterized protein n=1 Tax=Xanthobacter autotrophicus (strain ATCC BAA-1158 / Py2) TaxID=78245 RepID=A7ICP7_XANP2|nr:hypothetical protein Xaut_0534 [Xanthobacter autotrophicus Py2]
MPGETPEQRKRAERHRQFLEAADIGDAVRVQKFLDSGGIDVNHAQPRTGLTALHIAAARNAVAVVRILAASGLCDPALKDAQGRTAATLAVTVARNPALGRYLADLQYKTGVAAVQRAGQSGKLTGQGEA